ncbi:MAG: sugar phosphate isomerase, partial [Candidatus Binatia bacterium]
SWLLSTRARNRLADLAGVDAATAERIVRRHVGVCLDACHAAVEFENVAQSLESLRRAGLRVAKAQLSTGLAVSDVDERKREQLSAFADDVYLHQVVQRENGTLKRYLDLPEAIEAAGSRPIAPQEWRVHFHVPLFLRNLGSFENTQPLLASLLDEWKIEPFTDHLEVETYSWNMLPAEFRDEDVVEAVARELRWVVEHLSR